MPWVLHGQHAHLGGSACLHAIEADKVVQLCVLDNGQEHEEEYDQRHELATVVQTCQRPCMPCLPVSLPIPFMEPVPEEAKQSIRSSNWGWLQK